VRARPAPPSAAAATRGATRIPIAAPWASVRAVPEKGTTGPRAVPGRVKLLADAPSTPAPASAATQAFPPVRCASPSRPAVARINVRAVPLSRARPSEAGRAIRASRRSMDAPEVVSAPIRQPRRLPVRSASRQRPAAVRASVRAVRASRKDLWPQMPRACSRTWNYPAVPATACADRKPRPKWPRARAACPRSR
jgi:hypothetical protein